MTKQNAVAIHKAIDEKMNEIAKQFGFVYNAGRGTYNESMFRCKVEFISTTQTKNEVCGVPLTNEYVRQGFAPIGTKITYGMAFNPNAPYDGKPKETYLITSVGRSRYHVVEEKTQKRYTIPFRCCSLANPKPENRDLVS